MATEQTTGVSLGAMEWSMVAEAAARVRSSPDPEAAVRALVGELHEIALRDPARAQDASEMLVEIADRGAPVPARVSARCARAHVLSLATRFEEALTVLGGATDLSQATGDARSGAHVDHNAVQPLARLGRLTEAVARAERAVSVFEGLGDSVSAAKAHSNLAVIHRMRDDPVRALHHFELAIPPLRGMPTVAAQLESNRAEAMLDIADFAGAEKAFTRALEAFTEADAMHAAGVVEGNLADLLGRQGRLESALGHFERAGAALRRGGAVGDAARLEAERAEVLAAIGLASEAREAWAAAILELDRAGMPREAARARTSLAMQLVRAGRAGAGESVARAAAEALTRIGSRHGLARANAALGRAMLAGGRAAEGESLLRDAAEMLAERPADAAMVMHTLAEHLLASGRVDEAMLWTDRGGAIAETIEHPVLRASFLHARGRALAALGRPAEAAAQLRLAIGEIERLRGAFMGDRYRAAWLGDRGSVYTDLARIGLRRGDRAGVLEAFTAIERSRARSLLDMVRGGVGLAEHVVTGARTADEQELIGRLGQRRGELNAMFSWLEQRGARSDEARRADQGLRVRALEREIASLEGRLAATRRYTEVFGEPASPARVCAALGERDALVSYYEMDGTIGAMVVRRSGVESAGALCGVAAVEDSARRLAFQIDRAIASSNGRAEGDAGRLLSHAQRELRALHGLLISPIDAQLRGIDRLIVVPAGPIHALPIAALLGDEGYLVERMTPVVSPSASLFEAVAGAARPIGVGDRALVVGVADEVAPRVRDEARMAAGRLSNSTLLMDEQATVERFASEAARAAFVHLCCHGVFPAGQPMQARLRLGDRWMSAREAFSLNLPGSAVILSCCEGGRSAAGSGGEVLGLARALLAAGATTIVAGLWAAHDQATLELFEGFYDHVLGEERAGKATTAASALAAAQRSLMRDRPHPAFWGTFTCAGAP